MSNGFQAPNPSLFFSRHDPEDLRLGDLTKAITHAHTIAELHQALPPSPGFVIAGYPDDDGIQLNGGRKGAKDGPDAIRKYFYRMTPAVSSKSRPALIDIGN